MFFSSFVNPFETQDTRESSTVALSVQGNMRIDQPVLSSDMVRNHSPCLYQSPLLLFSRILSLSCMQKMAEKKILDNRFWRCELQAAIHGVTFPPPLRLVDHPPAYPTTDRIAATRQGGRGG